MRAGVLPIAAFAAMLGGLIANQAFAQAGTSAGPGAGPAASQPNQSESNSQSSNMGPATGNRGDANNGVGTQGSLDSSPGKASSTVSGVNGGTTSFGGSSSKGAGGPVESDPTQGGSKPPK